MSLQSSGPLARLPRRRRFCLFTAPVDRRPRAIPHTEAADEGIIVVAGPAPPWKLVQVGEISTSDDNILRFRFRDHPIDHILHKLAPMLLSEMFQTSLAHVIFECTLLVREVPELHGLNNAVHDHRRAKSRPQSQEQHLSASVAAKSLHRRVVDNLYR